MAPAAPRPALARARARQREARRRRRLRPVCGADTDGGRRSGRLRRARVLGGAAQVGLGVREEAHAARARVAVAAEGGLVLGAARASRGGWVGAREPVGKWEVGRPRTRAHRAAAGRAGCTARQGRAARLTVEEGLETRCARRGTRRRARSRRCRHRGARWGRARGRSRRTAGGGARPRWGARCGGGGGGGGGGGATSCSAPLWGVGALSPGAAPAAARGRAASALGARAPLVGQPLIAGQDLEAAAAPGLGTGVS